MDGFLKYIYISFKIIFIIFLWIVFLPVNILDFLWVRLVES